MTTPPVPLTAVRRTARLVRGAATRLGTRGDHGQATAEYGLIILAAGGIALGVIACTITPCGHVPTSEAP